MSNKLLKKYINSKNYILEKLKEKKGASAIEKGIGVVVAVALAVILYYAFRDVIINTIIPAIKDKINEILS